jgi:hypothetical protein
MSPGVERKSVTKATLAARGPTLIAIDAPPKPVLSATTYRRYAIPAADTRLALR